MTKERYATRAGATQFRPVMTSAEYCEQQEEYIGFCLACGDEAECVEPDARRYTCENCGQTKVYGLQELMLMNLIVLRDGNEAHP
jgi:hypothetical protein